MTTIQAVPSPEATSTAACSFLSGRESISSGITAAETLWGSLRQENGSSEIKLLGKTPYNISSFGEDEAGEIYLLDLKGSIYRLEKK